MTAGSLQVARLGWLLVVGGAALCTLGSPAHAGTPASYTYEITDSGTGKAAIVPSQTVGACTYSYGGTMSTTWTIVFDAQFTVASPGSATALPVGSGGATSLSGSTSADVTASSTPGCSYSPPAACSYSIPLNLGQLSYQWGRAYEPGIVEISPIVGWRPTAQIPGPGACSGSMSSYSLANGLGGTGGIDLVGLDGSCGGAAFDVPISQLGQKQISATAGAAPAGRCQASPFPNYSPQVQQTVTLRLVSGSGATAPATCGCGSRATQGVAGAAGCPRQVVDAEHAKGFADALGQTVAQLKRTGTTDKQLAQTNVLLKQLTNVAGALAAPPSSGPELTQAQRDEVFVNAGVALAGTLVKKGGGSPEKLAKKLETLAKQVQGKLSTDQQVTQLRKQVTDLITLAAPRLKDEINELSDQIGELAKVLAGSASQDELNGILSNAVVGLLERTAFAGELSPALFDGTLAAGAKCTVFLSAFQLGYGLAAPIGAELAKGIGTALNTKAAAAVVNALARKDSNWIETAAGGTPVIVDGKDPYVLGEYSVTAFALTTNDKTEVVVQGVVHTGTLGFQSEFLTDADSLLAKQSGDK